MTKKVIDLLNRNEEKLIATPSKQKKEKYWQKVEDDKSPIKSGLKNLKI
jgi:hypothetical protein